MDLERLREGIAARVIEDWETLEGESLREPHSETFHRLIVFALETYQAEYLQRAVAEARESAIAEVERLGHGIQHCDLVKALRKWAEGL